MGEKEAEWKVCPMRVGLWAYIVATFLILGLLPHLVGK
jgi:hypothetical protein